MYSHLPHGHPDKYPPEARDAMDQPCDRGQLFAYQQLQSDAKAKYAALEDCVER